VGGKYVWDDQKSQQLSQKKTTFLAARTAMLGGRPRRGGKAGTAEAGRYAALSLKVETVSDLSPICNLKYLKERSKTL
jgi:hypothetical protein